MRKFMQCCYTRVDGQSVDSGWQTVACSEELPLEVQKTYGSFMNSYIFGKIPENKSGKPIEKLLDITIKGNYLYYTRIRYGTADSLNRGNNMFAHTFLFPVKEDELVKNPNVFLTVKEGNFKESEEEAKPVPEELDRYPDFTLEEALEICGLDKEAYVTLIQGVYAQFYAKRSERKPLYICGIEEEKIPALLYCICMGIPFAMRRTLSCATENLNESLKKNLIFSDSYGMADWYLNVKTGQNNILTSRVMSRFERYGYVTVFPRSWDNPKLGQKFFEALENLAVKLGNPQASDAIILKIAYQMLRYPDVSAVVEEFDEETVNEKLYEALSSRSENSAYMDSYIAKMTMRATAHSWRLREEIEEILEEKLDNTQSRELLLAGEEYNISCISQCTPEKGAKKLKRLKEETFQVYSKKLIELSNGPEILDVYYSTYVLGDEVTWRDLEELLKKSAYVSVRPLTIDRVEEEAWKLYVRFLDSGEPAQKVFEDYTGIMSQTSEGPEKAQEYEKAAKEEYWEHVSLDNFTLSKKDEYGFFRIPNCSNSRFAVRLSNVLVRIINQGFNLERLLDVTDFAASNRTVFDEHGRQVLMDLLDNASSRNGRIMENQEREWYRIALYLMDEAMVKQAMDLCRRMLERKAGFAKDYDAFQTQMEKSHRDLRDVSQMINELYIDMAREGDEEGLYPVPLDSWLILGKYKYENPFQILDEEEMRILEEDSEILCQGSHLLDGEEYQGFAEDYVHDGGDSAKQVKEWMGILKKQRKQRKKEEKSFSPVSGIFNKFMKKTEREEPESQPREKKWRKIDK